MIWAWGLFSIYAIATAILAYRAGRGTASAEQFAIGSGHMSPWVAGVTLGACLASSATFAIVPGFVYAEGLPALIGFTLPYLAGIALGLFAFSPRFQEVGAEVQALTIPHWLGARYRSPGLRRLFAGLNVLNLAYLILITVGCSYVMEAALGVPYKAAVVGIVAFVFGYTAFGGAAAHAMTNTFQGVVMLVIALVLFASGLHAWPDAVASLQSSGWTAPGSKLFSTWWEVWIVPFFIGIALTTQPHLLAKALYVEDRRALRTTVWVGTGCFLIYNLVLFSGAYARVLLPADLPQDQIMGQYILAALPFKPLAALVSVAILAASMSTLDGLLVAISASVGNDLFVGQGSVMTNRLVLLGLAVATIGVALWPPKLILLLGQLGVYGLVVASAGPLLTGLFYRGELAAGPAFASAGLALAVHFGATFALDVGNPGVAAVLALAVSVPVSLVANAPAVRSRFFGPGDTALPSG